MAIPFAVAAGLGLVSTGASLFQGIRAGQDKNKALAASEKFGKELEQLKIKNMFEGLQVPTRGAELQRQATEQALATGVEAAKTAGAEGVIGLVPKLQQQAAKEDMATAARLEQLEYQRNLAQAQGAQQAENQNVAAQRRLATMRLQGSGMAAADAAQRQQQALMSGIQGLGTAAAMGLEYAPLYGKQGAGKLGRQARRTARTVEETGVGTIAPLAIDEWNPLAEMPAPIPQPAISPTFTVSAQGNKPMISPLQPMYSPEYYDMFGTLSPPTTQMPLDPYGLGGQQVSLGGTSPNYWNYP
jgi:hypothetical protein